MSVARSESIAELAKALCKAQSVMEGATKGKKNDEIRGPLQRVGGVPQAIER